MALNVAMDGVSFSHRHEPANGLMAEREREVAKFEIKHRWSGEVMFACELSAEVAGQEYGMQLGFAVKKAVEADANLARANLAGANLAGANLADANLARANLAGANLARANLADANLADANLAGANLAGANLADANLADAKNAEHVIAATRILPEGDLIGWKKCKAGVVVKLRIPADAKRSHAFGRKCRAEYVEVLEVIGAEVGISKHDGKTKYAVGETVRPDSFDDNWQDECAGGIHFFITRLEAEAY